MVDDKRQHTRVKDPTVVVKIASIDKFRSYYLRDLSAGGLFIRCSKLLPLNSEVDIKLVAPGLEEPLLLHGRVVRLEDSEAARQNNAVGMGVKFENLAPGVSERLAALVAAHSAPPAQKEATVDPVHGEIEGLIQELRIAREALGIREKELDEKKRKLAETQSLQAELAREFERLRGENEALQAKSTSCPPEVAIRLEQQLTELRGDCDGLRTENVELKARIAELEGQVQACRADVETAEADEAATRTLAERLAKEKAGLEKRRKDEAQAAGAELARLRAELESARADGLEENRRAGELARQLEDANASATELRRALDAEKEERSRVQAALAAARRDVERLEAELGKNDGRDEELSALKESVATERARSASLERQLADARGQLERVREKERDLRRLVALVSTNDEEVVVEEAAEGAEGAPAAPVGASPDDDAARASASLDPAEFEPAREADLPAPDGATGAVSIVEAKGPPPAAYEAAPVPDEPVEGEGESRRPASEDAAEAPAAPAIAQGPSEPEAPSVSVAPLEEPSLAAPSVTPPPSAPSGGGPAGQSLSQPDSWADALPVTDEPAQAQDTSAIPDETDKDSEFESMDVMLNTGALVDVDIAIDDADKESDDEAAQRAPPAPRERLTPADFGRLLRSGATLTRTEAFQNHTASGDSERQVMAWLEVVDSLSTLAGLARGTMSEEALTVFCYGLYEKKLIDVAETPAGG